MCTHIELAPPSLPSLRATYLAHLEAWREEVRVEGERGRREREEEAHTELDLRRHLHKPRQDRIAQDIHGVRAGIDLCPLSH